MTGIFNLPRLLEETAAAIKDEMGLEELAAHFLRVRCGQLEGAGHFSARVSKEGLSRTSVALMSKAKRLQAEEHYSGLHLCFHHLRESLMSFGQCGDSVLHVRTKYVCV